MDHVIPKSRGGCDCDENRVGSHRLCNNRKYNKTPLEYFMWVKLNRSDYWELTLREEDRLLVSLAKVEMKARQHFLDAHSIKPDFW